MIDRTLFTPGNINPPYPVFISDTQTVPTEQMVHLLADLLKTQGDVLEIGTGSGYNTAVLAERCRSVTSIEANPIAGVEDRLPSNVVLIHADGMSYDTGEKFDGVLVTFGARQIQSTWVTQLKDGARLVVPMVSGNGMAKIEAYERRGGGLYLVDVAAYAPFTPAVEA